MKFLTLIALIILPLLSIGQLITTSMAPASLVQSVFAGNGVTITNVQYTGSNGAIGKFTANGTNLGMTEGLIMTTGTIFDNGSGPQGPNNQEGAGMNNGAAGYGLLTTANGGVPTFDAAVLEFDFETCSDSISFNYVFGSEEYLDYVNVFQNGVNFNDVFGLFISGPGFSGSQNIASLPNGTVVAINNIHSAGTNVDLASFGPLNAQYYVNNYGGATIQYDGFTTVLTAKAKVQCNQVYHLIIAIADVGDPVWDSGIFLEAHSFNANSPVDLSHVLSANMFNSNDIIAEGCVSTTLTLERSDCNLNSPMTVQMTPSGTAIEGVDYDNIPSSITFPAGASQTQFSFNCFADGLTEPQETLDLTFTITDNCGNVTTQVMHLFIQDINDVNVEITGGTIFCPGEEIELIANASGGASPYTYLWSTGETTQSIFVSPGSTQTYSVTVTDDCLHASASADFEVVVPILPPLLLNETPDITEICPYIPALLEANASGGTPPYSYQWSSNFDPNLGNSSTVNVIPSTTTTYTVVVTDNCGLTTTADVVYTITSPPLVLTMSPAVEICPGDSAFISVEAFGGYGQYYYNWLHSGETEPGIWVHPTAVGTTTYTVSVSDECQTFVVLGSTNVTVIKPIADFTTTSTTFFNGLPITFLNLTQNAVSYEWDFGDGNTDTFTHPSNTYDVPGTYYITLVATDDKGCTDTITKPISIEEEWYIYIPNTFTPDGDRSNNDFRAVTIGIRQLEIGIYNRWGQLIFEALDKDFVWDGTYNGAYVNDGTYTYSVHFITNSGRDKNIHGHVNVLK